MNSAIVLAAGNGTRTKLNYNKVLYKIKNQTLLEIIIEKFINVDIFDEIIIVCSKKDIQEITKLFQIGKFLKKSMNIKIIIGGDTRQKSVWEGVKESKNEILYIHDGARPFVSCEKILEIEKKILKFPKINCFTLAIDVVDTIAIKKDNLMEKTLKREVLCAIQTPQVIKKKMYMNLYQNSKSNYTDETALFQNNGQEVMIIAGEIKNKKITNVEDIKRMEKNDFK